MLTTIDNPYNPFTHFDEWLIYDIGKGYNTCAYLARIVKTSDFFTEKEEEIANENAIDEIISFDPFNLYTKVYSDSSIDSESLVKEETSKETQTKESEKEAVVNE